MNERPTSTKEWARHVGQTRARLAKRAERNFPPGSTRKCPECGKRTLESRDDLVRETQRHAMMVVHHHLHGARCKSCGIEILEIYEDVALEDALDRFAPDYAAKVTAVSGRNLGTYWPKDVVRVMNLHSQDALLVQILDQDTMVLRRTTAGKTDQG